MLITNHVLSGAVVGHLVGRFTGRADVALAAGLVSHFVLDAVPHFGVDSKHLMKVAVPDGLTGLATIGAVAAATPRTELVPVLAAVFGACLPDLDKPGEAFFGRSPFPGWVDRFHSRIQREAPHMFAVEVATAVVLTTALRNRLRGRSRVPLAGAAGGYRWRDRP